MHQKVREIIWEISCFYLKQLVLSVWLGFFSFSNWIGSCSCAVCGRCRNTALKRCLKPVLPCPILPLPPCLLGSRKPWAFLTCHSSRMSLGPQSPHQPPGADHLILIKVLPVHHRWAAGGFLCL